MNKEKLYNYLIDCRGYNLDQLDDLTIPELGDLIEDQEEYKEY